MSIESIIEIIIALTFFVYMVYRNNHNHRKITRFHKPHLHKKLPYKGNFIISWRDIGTLENDHTGEYISNCWDEIEKKH